MDDTKFTWKFKNFSNLTSNKLYSDFFFAGGYKWRILVLPKGNTVGVLPIYLVAEDSASLPDGWSRHARFSLSVINQFNKYKTRSREILRKFTAKGNNWGHTLYITLEELNDPSGGYIVNDTCIVEAEVSVTSPIDVKKETVTQSEASTKFEIQCVDDFPLPVTNSRKSFISPPPANIQKPSSTLKNRSNIANTMLQLFMEEFDSDFPTYEKFGKVMEDLRASMYGGNMGDIFEEWRPRILEIEALLAEIEDMEHECEENQEASLWEALSKTLVALFQFEQTSTQAEEKITASLSLVDSKHQELQTIQQKLTELRRQMAMLLLSEKKVKEDISAQESKHENAISEKEEADKEIKKLNQQKDSVTKNMGDVQARAEIRRIALAEKKAAVQEWISNPLPSTK